ncbi:L-fucose:H+ symporter permease [Mucilaginibacter sp. FT3.2]|uniref:L-fucose:H+ symporter permease n=1 Tax=Mucilaginibacter sp. FT3.2 TaxID=2723090 RepID=UPI00160B025C|nr:L-fucose:H+ symporter permease [Mucilaginibacter sp. FT3.2]MBB6232846.1 FHS family L-fucose permease-like MFS transporter [Mucilaginibacter sp. FT3.2]
MSKDKKLFAVGLITSLFFVWGFALNLNPILIPHLKKACQLTDLQSSLVDSASYIGYFVMAIPAGLFMKRFGYKGGIIVGLTLCALGAFLFYPAASVRSYAFFLTALFIIACGLAFLETAANPYMTALGDPESAAFRLNFAQSFNGLAATVAPYVGGLFILSETNLTAAQESSMAPSQLSAYLNKEASAVQIPFLIIGAVVLLLAIILYKTSLPEIADDEEAAVTSQAETSSKTKNLVLGVIAQFFYVGAQVCVSSFFIRFAGKVAGIPQKPASIFLAIALAGFMSGRFIGTFLMKYIRPAKLLAIYCVINVFLVILAVMLHGKLAVYALMGVEFFMSIMFPTIFSLSIRGLGAKTKLGSSLVIMAIVGGAVFPPLLGFVSDKTNIQVAYLVPAVCFLFVLYFALTNLRVKEKVDMSVAH